MSKIIGVPVGTPLNPEALKQKLNPVTSVNDVTPDENGNVEITISEQDSSTLFVDIISMPNNVYRSSPSYSEIKTHLNNGGFAIGQYFGTYLSLYEVGANYIAFLDSTPGSKTEKIYRVYESGTVTVVAYAHNHNGEYLTEHQDISGKLDASALPTAINTALEQAKESGEFNGHDYVLTPADKQEIAEMAAELVEVPDSGGNTDFKTDETLILENGILSVNTTNDMEQDNTLPITSAGVFATVGNIEALLKTI
jgi:hypothetical protein